MVWNVLVVMPVVFLGACEQCMWNLAVESESGSGELAVLYNQQTEQCSYAANPNSYAVNGSATFYFDCGVDQFKLSVPSNHLSGDHEVEVAIRWEGDWEENSRHTALLTVDESSSETFDDGEDGYPPVEVNSFTGQLSIANSEVDGLLNFDWQESAYKTCDNCLTDGCD